MMFYLASNAIVLVKPVLVREIFNAYLASTVMHSKEHIVYKNALKENTKITLGTVINVLIYAINALGLQASNVSAVKMVVVFMKDNVTVNAYQDFI